MILSSPFYKGESTYDAKTVKDAKDETVWKDSVLYHHWIGDIDEHSYCDCFEHSSILSLSICFLLLCSRTVKGTEGGSRTHRDGAYLSVLRLRWWRALRRSLRSVQSPDCSQEAPTPSLFLSSVSIGVVLLASG